MDIVAQGLERRYVHNLSFVRERSRSRRTHQTIQADQKRGECLSRAGWSGYERIASGRDLRPA